MSRDRFIPLFALVVLGAAWGLTMPLTKIAVSGDHGAMGLVVWELIFAIIVLFVINAVRRRPIRFRRQHLPMFLFIAFFGNLVPNIAWFITAKHLPSGILAIVLSLVPMFALPVALLMRLERFQWIRLIGVLCGAVAIVLLIGPETSLPEPDQVWWLLLALVGPFCYGIEGNGVAKMGLGGLDSVQMLLGATIVSLAMALPITFATGQWVNLYRPWGEAELALVVTSVLTTIAYAGYVWLVGRAGSVFATQVSYLVTGFGVLWSILLLAEVYSGWVWLALAMMLAGLGLIQPRPTEPLVSGNGKEETEAT
jgi:drug/metabolite transporter (DMT)-like permease